MNGSLTGLIALQALYLVVGAGLLPVLRVAPTPTQLLRRLGLAYLVGVAAVGVVGAHLALVDVPLGLLELSLLAVLSAALGLRRVRRRRARAEPVRPPRTRLDLASAAVAVAAAIPLLVLLVDGARAFGSRPLKEWDGWAIWATKARALYEFGGTYEPVFASYQPVAHPILFPSLEAIGFRSMGAFDGTLIHVQLLALALGFVAALWSLLADRVPAGAIAAAVTAIVAATPVLAQLSTNLADVPLALLVAVGVACLGRYVLTGEGWTLVLAALFLGAAMLTKSEGLLFATAAFVAAAAAVAPSGRRMVQVALSTAAAIAMLVPWRVYLAAHDLRNPEYALSDLLDPGYLADRSDRVSPAVSRLATELASGSWGLLLPLALVGLAGAALARRYRLSAFALLWPVLAFTGLVLVYWISVVPIDLTLTWTASRIVDSLVIGTAALAPLLIGEAWRVVRSGEAAS